MKSLIEQFPDDSERLRERYKLLHPRYSDQVEQKARQLRLVTVAIGCITIIFLLIAYGHDFF